MRLLLHRWAYFVLGGALCTPYALFAVLVAPLAQPREWTSEHAVAQTVALSIVTLALLALTAQLPAVRTLEATAVRALLGGPASDLEAAPARTRGARLRAAVWFLGHTIGGALVSLATVLGVPIALVLLAAPWRSQSPDELPVIDTSIGQWWAVPLALAIPVVLVTAVALLGRAAAWLAPVLLGPDPVARMEQLERRASDLAERNRLAQELNDSLGHALTVTTLQASAARRVLATDPAFAEHALDAIERTSRIAAADLDNVLGILRDQSPGRTPRPTLGDLDQLIAGHRDAGLPLTLDVDGELTAIAGPVSREVYRIVQEGLTNAARHAGNAPTSVELRVNDAHLTLRVRNRIPPDAARPARGGAGLTGIRDRVRLLRGELSYGPSTGPNSDAVWLLEVRVPTGAAP